MERSQISAIKEFLNSYESPDFDSVLFDEFEQLKYLTNEIRHFNTKSTVEGERECNRRKNRYRDIVPYDESRVILKNNSLDQNDKPEPGQDYINASFVDSALDGHYKYIASQGPNKETCLDFIRMLYQYNIKIVICACNEYEGQKLKCHRYWTDSLNDQFKFHKNYHVTLKSKPIQIDGCIIRELVVRYNNPSSTSESSSNSSFEFNDLNEFEFTQFHITDWPDHGVPDNVDSIIKMLNVVRQKMYENNQMLNESVFMKNYENNKKSSNSGGMRKRFNKIPLSSEYLAVHCSAGCGRTGTIIAIDQVWTIMNENKITSDFSMYSVARLLREQRIAMIQTLSQYTFFAKAIVYLFEKKLKTYNDTSSSQAFRDRHQTKMSQSNYENVSPPIYENILTPPDDQHNSYQNRHQYENFYVNSDEKIILRQHTPNSSQLNKRVVRRSYIVDSQPQNQTPVLANSDENIKKKEFSSSYETSKSFNFNNKKSAFNSVRGQSSINSKINSDGSLTVNASRNRYNSPNVFNIFNSGTSASQTNNTPNASTTNSASSTSSTMPIAREKFQGNEATTPIAQSNRVTEFNQMKGARLFMDTGRQTVNMTPNSVSQVIEHQVKPRTLALKETNNSENNGTGFSKPTSPLNCLPRKLFNSNGLVVSPGEKLPDTFSMSGSLYLDNSASTTDASTGTGRIVNKGSNNFTELYLNDEAMYKKEAGSVCEFLSNRLDHNNNISSSNNNNKSPRQSPSITSLDATASLSSSPNSTPVTTPTTNVKSHFQIAHSQVKLSHGKQVDLKRVPLKAEIHDSPNAVREPLIIKESTGEEVQIDQPPQPPVRRSKKLQQQQDTDNLFQISSPTPRTEMKFFNLNNVNTPRYQNTKISSVDNTNGLTGSQLSPRAVVYRNRSSSSSTYENIERLSQFYQKYGKNEASIGTATKLTGNKPNDNDNNNNNEQNVRNGLYIDMNLIKELRSKKTKPQFKLKSQKLNEKNINQTLPTRRLQPASYNDYNNESVTYSDEHKRSNPANNKSSYNRLYHDREHQQSVANNLKSPTTIKLRHANTSSSNSNRAHLNQHFYIKNKLYNLTDQNSKHFFEKASHSKQTNRFEDFYDNFYPVAYPQQGKSKNSEFHFLKNSDLIENKRRSAHLFNL